MQKSQKEF